MSDHDEIEKLKKDFQFTLSKVSHEVRNPVTIIKSYLQLMAEKYPQVEQFDYWEDIQENMSWLINLLNELSTYNNAGKLHMEPIDMYEFTTDIVHSVHPAISYMGMDIQLDSVNQIPMIMGDKMKLREAILNLIRNSWEAMSKGGLISLKLSHDAAHVILAITDEGSGIPEEYLPDLFHPFITHKQEGTGLGLAIAYQVLTAHGGNIQVESVPGIGTTFLLTFPVNH